MKSFKTSTGNPVKQLELLRSFVIGATTTRYSEQDLFECLKQSGYNVQRAAELLITGQFRSVGSVRTAKKGTNAGNPRVKSAFFQNTAIASPARKKLAQGPLESSHNHSSNTNGKVVNSPVPRVSMTPTPTTITVSTPTGTPRKSISSRKSIPQNTSFSIPPSHECVLSPRMDFTTVQPRRERFLLCRRWISDATITCRSASIRYRQVLSLDYTGKGYCRVGFRSTTWNSSLQGRLPDNIALLLSPLLRHQSQEPLLDVVLESMMDEPNLVMGSSLPIQITIYLKSPKEFFDLMIVQASDTNPVSAASQYFAQRKNRAQSKKKKSANLPVHEAAFLLLQWAQYGDVPEFETAADVAATKNGKSVVSIEQEVIDIDNSQCTPSDADNEDENEFQELNEEDFENESTEAEGNDGSALESSVELGTDSWTLSLPDDCADPVGLAEHVTLRSYQKQALYFMFQRETTGMDREQVEDQLRLLEELVSEQKATSKHVTNWNGPPHGDSVDDIVCECGPVIVSENGRKRSTTLNGTTDPISHPLWQRRYLALPCFTRSITFFVNELLGTATYVTPEPPKHCSGGILADAMGLGKTVMLLALILKSKESRNVDVTDLTPKATLVIAKLSLLPQWEEELKTKTNLKYKIFYGSNTGKPIDVVEFLDGVDVVVTTYGTVQGELRQKFPVLQRCQWLRVILDEAHCIRNQRTLASKACCSLIATHRWCVSGTIIQNSLDDVYGIMKFLQHEPWCIPSFWKTAITRPFQPENGDAETSSNQKSQEKSLNVTIERVRRVLNPIMIRRTKDSLTKEGLPILTLPPIETKVIRVDFSESEREFYNAVLARSLEVFDGFIKEGTASRAYFQIFSLLSRLRQACDHIALTVKSKIDDEDWLAAKKQHSIDSSSNTRTKAPEQDNGSDALGPQFLDDLLQKFYKQQQSPKKTNRQDSNDTEHSAKRSKFQSFASKIARTVSDAIEDNATHMQDECPICLERPEIGTAVLTPCAHIFCRQCLLGVFRNQTSPKSNILDAVSCPDGICPTCQEKVDARRIIALSKSNNDDDGVCCITSTFLTAGKAERTIKQHVLETQDGNPFAVARQILENAVSGTESSKLNAIMTELNEVWKQDPGSKVLIFSHYLGFLDLLGTQCDVAGIPFFRLDGSLNIRERMTVLDDFRRSETPVVPPDSIHKGTVLLMSMSAGGEGLNIVSASTCFIVEPWWNSAKEDQCQNRIHRFGQEAPIVRVRKFIVNDSVEERIVELQQRKAFVAGEIYSDAGRVGEIDSARLTLDDFRLIFRSN